MPYPVGRGVFVWGAPLWVSPDATPEELEVKRRELEEALNALTARADEATSRGA